MTVRGFLVGDDWEGSGASDDELRNAEQAFRQENAHAWCGACTSDSWALFAFVWPRKGFSEFPLDCKPPLAPVVQSV